ncbi:hypothetical protein J31TS6_33990 [Brevibacillus reuszeri]|uniref:hypothetical protein n=1 Tax=Brevibacillus reuszeri TaxID=54915 RepID=UPI001B2F65E7|nr:hypothetical protein [Brevibacillus reuszeri]GIO07371.1 hypothetical protein J31TS6_33990 [Brevibacillus reuszeri]
MDSNTNKQAIYSERVTDILRGLVEGKTRDELAEEFGYKNYKTLDIYMRRRNFVWDRYKQYYVHAYSKLDSQEIEVGVATSSKVATVISMFQKEGADAKTIAKRLGFTDHRDLATYMKGKGYKWSYEIGNYQKVYGRIETEDTPLAAQSNQVPPLTETPLPSIGVSLGDSKELLERFWPLLELLERNRGRLIDLIVPGAESGTVPRYAVPGIFVTKSVHMTNTLDQMVREYSKEKNISQRDIFAVALIEFFQRYGYEREIETLLGR